jgi:hypothetical protein
LFNLPAFFLAGIMQSKLMGSAAAWLWFGAPRAEQEGVGKHKTAGSFRAQE